MDSFIEKNRTNMKELNIITIWYNEERNLHKLYRSLDLCNDSCQVRKIYIDQSSNDKSVFIAEEYWCETYIYPNKWYADPDKKRAVENLCHDDDWILILDADEEVTRELANEIHIFMQWKQEIGNILIRSIILWWFWWEAYQPRLFQKKAVELTNEIHNYISLKSKKVTNLKNPIINNDLKYKWKEIEVMLEKTNRYTSKEVDKIWDISLFVIYLKIIFMPLIRFFYFLLKHKQILRGLNWIIFSMIMAYYQFLIYAKIYEKKHHK